MKQALPFLLASALAGALGGTVAAVLLGARETRPVEARSSSAASTEEPAMLELSNLRRETQDLRMRIAELEARSDASTSEPPARKPAPPPDKATEDLSESAALRTGDASSQPMLTAQVEQALTDIRAAEDAERAERRKEAMEIALESRVDQLAQDLGLASWQKNELRTALGTAQEKREELWESLRESPERWAIRDSFRDQMRAISDETHQALSGFLTEDQLQHFEAETPPWFRGGFDEREDGDRSGDRNRRGG
jgi:hypothetical protein